MQWRDLKNNQYIMNNEIIKTPMSGEQKKVIMRLLLDIFAWIILAPVCYVVLGYLMVLLIPITAGLAALIYVGFFGIALAGVWLIFGIINIFYLKELRSNNRLEFTKITHVLFIIAIISPAIIPAMTYYKSEQLENKEMIREKAYYEKQVQEGARYLSELNFKNDQLYSDYKNKVEGVHEITKIEEHIINKGVTATAVTFENGETFDIIYWYPDTILKNLPIATAIEDGKKFSNRKDLLGKKFTFTFYSREDFDYILRNPGTYSVHFQIFPPKEARSGDY